MKSNAIYSLAALVALVSSSALEARNDPSPYVPQPITYTPLQVGLRYDIPQKARFDYTVSLAPRALPVISRPREAAELHNAELMRQYQERWDTYRSLPRGSAAPPRYPVAANEILERVG